MIPELRKQIWSLSGESLAIIDKAKASVMGDPAQLHYWECLYREVDQLMKPRKRPKTRKPTLTEAHQQRYVKAYHDYQARNFPAWVKGGHTLDPRPVDTGTANGLQTFIINFLTWSGHFGNRTGNEGRVIVVEGEAKRIKSSSKNGMQDIDTNLKHPAHPYGIPWKIEVKVGKDTHKTHQKDYGKLVQKTGGVYSVVRSAVDFFNQYDSLMIEQKELFSS